VIDLKKEIKLSDLVRRTEKAGKRGGHPVTGSHGIRPSRLRRHGPHELVGVKIGATQLAAARVRNDGSPHLLRLARQPLPAGIVHNGEVRDVHALAAGLQEFFTANELPRRVVRLGIATNHVGVRTFEIAGIEDERQLANAVLFRAHEAVSIPVDEAIIDYRVLDTNVDDAGVTTRKILLVAAYREPIERYIAAFKEVGIRLVGIDLEAFALLRAVARPANGSGPLAAVIAVSTGHERTTLAVSDGQICSFTRVIEWGGSNILSAIARELTVPLDEAASILPLISFGAGSEPGLVEDARIVRAREAARLELQSLGRELVASLQFYQGQPGSLPIAEILFTGGTSRIAGIDSELERLTRVRVRLADPLVRFADDEVEERDDIASLAVAIGLGVDD
jgi:type IV pilus assembly protein PilM